MFVVSSRAFCRSGLSLALLLSAVLAAPGGHAQTISSTLLGAVTDPTGNLIPKAVVVVTNESTGDQRSTITDATGGFTFASLLPGSYTVKVEATGFRAFVQKNNVLTANE